MPKNILKFSVSLASLSLLTACGGGGGGSSVSNTDSSSIAYTGSTQPASISSPTIGASYVDLYASYSTSNSYLEGLGYSLPASSSSPASTSKTLAETNSAEGECGGTIDVTDNSTDSYIDFSLNADNYCIYDLDDARLTIDGYSSMQGDENYLEMTYRDFFMNYPAYDLNFGIDGSLTFSSSETSSSIDISRLVILDKNSGDNMQLENWTETFNDAGDMLLDGRMYHPDYGYVDVSTNIAMDVDIYSEMPVTGEIALTSTISSATITFSSNSYYIEVDNNNDGIVDSFDTFYY